MDGLEDFLSVEQQPTEVVAEPAPEAPIEAPSAAETPTEAVETPPETAERPRGPDGKFIAKEPAAPPQEPQFEHAATIGERRRRQEAEAERDALRQQLAQFQQPQQPQAQQQQQGPPDRWEDPEGYDQWLVGQASEAARSEAYYTFQNQRILTAATEAMTRLPDYVEKIDVFQQMAQANPALLGELYRSSNPAEYAYGVAKTQLEITQHGGIEGLIRARIDEALKTQAPAPQAQPPIPDTLADAQSSRGSSHSGPHVPTLDEILKR